MLLNKNFRLNERIFRSDCAATSKSQGENAFDPDIFGVDKKTTKLQDQKHKS